MRLLRFRVTNFRSVVDSGWIEVDRVTALIGVNESGKTNLLLPLWKLNPAREGEIVPTSDYPKANYAAIRAAPGDYNFIRAEFEIPELADALSNLTGVPASQLQKVHVVRNFAGAITIEFPEFEKKANISGATLVAIVESAETEIGVLNALQKEGTLKTDALAALSAVKQQTKPDDYKSADELKQLADSLRLLLPDAPAATSTVAPRLLATIEEIEGKETQLRLPDPEDIEGVYERVTDNLPRFVYYSNYGNLDSEIYLPHVVQNLERTDLGAREAAKARTLRVLFTFVRLQPQEILELGKDFVDPQGRQPTSEEIAAIATKKRERTILLNSAGTDLTKTFRDWWKQGDYTFEFQADGNHFRIWVSDSRRPEKVELEDRSSGLQWFLSFYLIFLVESSRDHRDSILLLDEPGLSLHPLAQRDLTEFFENLAQTNTILFTTHSPFLVDADMLDRVRKVYVAEDGSTKASADLRRGSDDPRKSGATYAIYSALNMNVAESILYGCYPIIVEGPSDQHYLATIKTLLIAANKISPKREIVFPPSHGARNAKVVATILTGRDDSLPFMLLDGDDVGLKMATDMQNGLYQSAKDRVVITDKYVGFKDSEIEDLFPPHFVAEAVDRIFRTPDVPFADGLKSGPIVPQIEAWAAQHAVVLEDGWKVDLSRVKRRALGAGAKPFAANLDKWADMFKDLGST